MKINFPKGFNRGNLARYEENVVKELESVDLPKTRLVQIKPLVTRKPEKNIHHTEFLFEIRSGVYMEFVLYQNKQIVRVSLIGKEGKEYLPGILAINQGEEKEKQEFLDEVWNSFVTHFNLKIKLIYVNEDTPWRF